MLPLIHVTKLASVVVSPTSQVQTVFHNSCIVFEDNNGALVLATTQRTTSRTKYFNVKWHFFWQYIKNGTVQVEPISTTDQLADYLTKGLTREVFERIRKAVQGW